MEKVLLVITTLPDEACAHAMAQRLVEAEVAACVNVMAPCRSVYHWRGKIEQACETPLFIKTTTARYAALEGEIRSHHPYEMPEIVALPITAGWPPYLDWIAQATEPVVTSC